MWLLALFLIAVTLLYYFVLKYKKSHSYWKQRNVPTLSPHPIFGDITKALCGRENVGALIVNAYFRFKEHGHKFGGLYFLYRPVFIPIDPQLVRNIIVKDFDHFTDRGIIYHNELGAHLFNLSGDDWKALRQKLTPTFTSGKLKGMMGSLLIYADRLNEKIQRISAQNADSDIELNDYFEQVGMDIIGHVAFGLDCNTLNSQNANFYAMARRVFKPKFINIIKFLLLEDFTNPGNLISLTTSDSEMCNFFIRLIKDTVKHRQELQEKHKDFLQLLINIYENDELTLGQVAAQTFIFFIAAFETSSKALNLTMYELSKNQELQKKLRTEISDNIKTFSYDEIMQNKLLDMIFKETLRKHPSVVLLHRKCTKDYQITPQTRIDEGTVLLIPIYAFHHDPEYFIKPNIYDPLRFDDENKEYGTIDPLTYFPFGDGPRNCIGMRFGMMQVKLIIAKLIATFEFFPSGETIEPLEFNPITDNLLLTYKNPIKFHVNKI